MFCTNCGKEIREDSKFCMYCGNNIIKTENSEISLHSENNEETNKILEHMLKSKSFVIAIIIFVILILVVIVISNGGKKQAVLPQMAEWIWKERAHVSLSEDEVITETYTAENEVIVSSNVPVEENEMTTEVSAILKKSQTFYFTEDGEMSTVECRYDEYGNVISETHRGNSDSVEMYTNTYSYEYDTDGNVQVKYEYINEDELQVKRTYTEYGDESSYIIFSPEGNTISENKYVYDAQGNILEVSHYYTMNSNREELKLTGREVYVYNQEGLVEYQSTYDSEGKETFTTYYEYDSAGNVILSYTVDSETGAMQSKVEYDLVKNASTIYWIWGGTNISMSTYEERNNYGDILVYKEYDSDGNEIYEELYQYDYETDALGRITGKKTYQFDNIAKVELFEYD